MSALKTWCALAVTFGVAACAALAPDSRISESSTPFDMSARVVVSYDGRAFSSGVRWEHAGQRDEIWLLSPIGQTLAYITAGPDGATLTSADQKQYRATSVERLTREALGWELPLSRLQFWVQGKAVPGSTPGTVERDASERLTALTQDGWNIAFVNYPPDEHGGLPRRLVLGNGAQEIRLVIDAWRRNSNAP